MQRKLFSLILCLCLTLAEKTVAQAQPSITAAPDGTGTIATPAGTVIEIRGGTQAGNNLFHSFSQFSVEPNQTANFLVHPSIQAILSRVIGGDPSHIDGLLQVTGSRAHLYLMNPAGIVFGAGARLDVAGSFTATTANAIGVGCGPVQCEGWFPASGPTSFHSLTGIPNSFAFVSSSPGAILNAGMLSVLPGQSLTLVGGTVINTGTLTAPGGTIAVVAVPGERFVRVHETGQLLSLDLPLETKNTLTATAQPFTPIALPQLLTGSTLAEATGVTVDNGVIRLTRSGATVATPPGTTVLSGQVSVAGAGADPAGTLQILGDRVTLQAAHLDASGTQGGTILIGGDYRGSGIVPNAKFTQIDHHSTIAADGISQPDAPAANGGRVIAWADETMQFSGKISAQGGALGGNGGFVETSGKLSLAIGSEATVTTAAPQGQMGTWLLDPTHLAVVAAAGTGAIAGGTNVTPDSTIDASVVVAALNSANVTLHATHSITIDTLLDATANLNPGNLTLQAPTVNLNQPIWLKPGSTLNGTATTVNVGATGSVQNAVDVAGAEATIHLAPATYTLTQQVNLDKNLTLIGSGETTIQANGRDRVFQVNSGQTIALENLTLTNGAARNGGGIYNSGSLTLTNSTVTNNQAADEGGGIYNTGSLSLINSTVTNNQSARSGGGIYNTGSLDIETSTIDRNEALFSNGGAIHNRGTLSLRNSTIDRNRTEDSGGGVYNTGRVEIIGSTFSRNLANTRGASGRGGGLDNRGVATITNSTFSGNRVLNTRGGGIYNTGTLSLTSSTLTQNGASREGGGIYNTGIATLQNTIVAANSAAQSPDLVGAFADQGYNFVGVVDGGRGLRSTTLFGTQQFPLDPKLGPLANNGGFTKTHALLPGSRAIAAGTDSSLSRTDQRGVLRSSNNSVDIGAVQVSLGTVAPELGSLAPVALVNLVQSSQTTSQTSSQTTSMQSQAMEERSPTESSLSVPVLTVNLQADGEAAVTAVDGTFRNAYEQHFGFTESNPTRLDQIQTTLTQLKQQRGISSALIYAAFIPKVGSRVAGQAVSPRPDDQLQLILVRRTGKPIVRSVGVTRAQVVAQARLFRLSVADPEDARTFVPIARQLYRWLLAPIEPDLQAETITHLVFCLDEGLRTIPLAALMNQDQFLIERYAVSVIPSAALANLDVTPPSTSKILAMGADRFVSKNPLPAVPLELQAISLQVANPTIALNEAFTLENLLRSQQQTRPEMLHLATHAEFNAGAPDRSYIQLWDTKLTLDQVKALNWKTMNLTLLTLSACTTAIGDREAELGFAGLAFVSGVRSTLGSLWLVSDVGTLALMNEFYSQLKTTNTLATALQKAQLSLLRGTAQFDQPTVRSLQRKQLLSPSATQIQSSQFSHPFYWSAFSLVGNPW
ncbi:MAG: CHAT domain-containing protein [Leptolyngbyaceae cyanobacterium bins.349]|nr:CHAT domain-containing protein [Leptolyngbyaceae cyanobacterium bins.349]